MQQPRILGISITGALCLALSAFAGSSSPPAALTKGWALEVAAAAPLVQHPIMGCLDDRGRLFVGDSAGVNLKKDELEKQRPHRVLLLEDVDHDGRFEKSTVFADQMTFPQGACWLAGSLYVCSPPSLWKLTDTNADGMADRREELVTGFDYTGNAADIHGPFLHPNGRLYWCHGRKGHKVQRVQMVDGVRTLGDVVHEGLACGIWSCKADGSDVAWHSLGCGDNPVEIDFTPEGDVLGVQNLYYNQPRGDTLVHWLYGGVYERADQLQAIAGLPRTLEKMPVVYNFGHVAVSGCCIARHPSDELQAGELQMYVTHFNTQRLVRMELTQEGASYKATEHEFLKLSDPDIHLTDVMEDRDGSLLLINTGGWFRIGCPSSMIEKPDVLGAIYRVRRNVSPGPATTRKAKASPNSETLAGLIANLAAKDPRSVYLACDALDQQPGRSAECRPALLKLLATELDPTTEHAAMHLAMKVCAGSVQVIDPGMSPALQRRLLVINHQTAGTLADTQVNYSYAEACLDAGDEGLARAALALVKASPLVEEVVARRLSVWLEPTEVAAARLRAVVGLASAILDKAYGQKLITTMLSHASVSVQNAALQVLAGQASSVSNDAWLAPLEARLSSARKATRTSESVSLPVLLEAIAKLKAPRFDAALQDLANDKALPVSLCLKALAAISSSKGGKLDDTTFDLLMKLLADPANAAARITAAEMLGKATMTEAQLPIVLAAVAGVGPMELGALLSGFRKYKAEQGRLIAASLAQSPVLGSIQESQFRTVFSAWPEEVFNLLRPAITTAVAATDAKRSKLEALSIKAEKGHAAAGRKLFETGMGTCIACHQIGDKGRAIGPNLSKIGAIRRERDLLESILFPSNTLARDYEMHAIEMSDGRSLLGIIKSHTAEGLLIVDAAGQESEVPHGQITAEATLATSLMPAGLDMTLSEAQLLDLVAYLRGLH